MHRYETIFEQLEQIDENSPYVLREVTQLIYKFYLTPKEKTYYKCLQMYYSDKKQRELSILLNIDQPNLSAKFAKLRRKLRVIADFLLSEEQYELFQLKDAKTGHKAGLTGRQYEILMYLLAGNRAYHISQHLQVSPVAIHQTTAYLKKKLPDNSLPARFLRELGTL